MIRSARVTAAAIAVFGSAVVNSLRSQPPAAHPTPQGQIKQEPLPIIRTGTRLVEVEVVVRDKDGSVTGLTRDDFTLLDQGEKQKIAEFSAGVSGGAGPAGQPAAPLPPETVSNRTDRSGHPIPGNTVLLLDLLNTSFDNQGYARAELLKFLDAAPAGERIAIYMLGKDLTAIQDFTDNPGAVKQAVKKWDPKDLFVLIQNTENMDAIDRANADNPIYAQIRAETTAQAIAKIVQHLSGTQGRKNLVWVSDKPGVAGAQFLGAANIHLYPVLARSVATSGVVGMLRDQREMGRAGLAAPAGLGGGDELDRERANAALAAANGGVAFMDSSSISRALQTAMEDAQDAYVLGFYPSEDSLNNTFHTLTVNVRKNGAARDKTIEIRYRPGYLATRAAQTPQNAAAVGPSSPANPRPVKPRPTLDQLLNDPLDISQVQVEAEPAPDPSRPGAFQIRVKIDPRDLVLVHANATRSGFVDISFSVVGSRKVLTKPLKVDIPDDQYDDFHENGIQSVETIDISGGPGALRVVVQDRASGAAGSVTVPLRKR